MLQKLREICKKIIVLDFNIIIIDNEENFIVAIFKIFSFICKFLCL